MLKKFFANRKQKKYHTLFRAELDGSLLAADQFITRMRQERLRSERSGSPLSLVVIDSARMLDFLVGKNSVSHRALARHIAGVINNSTRESDVKGWYESSKIGLLTVDTDAVGRVTAHVACNVV